MSFDVKKWLIPVENAWECPTFAYHKELGWLHCDDSLKDEVSAVMATFLSQKDTGEWSLKSSEGLIIGVGKAGRDGAALLEMIFSYTINQGAEHYQTHTMNRRKSFEMLIENRQSTDLPYVIKKYFSDSGQKVLVLLESEQTMAKQIEDLLCDLGHEDVTVLSPNRVLLMLHLKKNDGVLELIEGIYSLIEEALYVSVHMGVSEAFYQYTGLVDRFIGAECALNACRLTVDNRGYCLANKDILPMLLANPHHRLQVIGGIDTKGLKALMADGELVSTLECFLKVSLNISEAASKLFIHRNTLLYRLSKIEKLTGFDPRNFSDAMNLFTMVSVEKVGSGV